MGMKTVGRDGAGKDSDLLDWSQRLVMELEVDVGTEAKRLSVTFLSFPYGQVAYGTLK